jgi:putative transposase
MPNYRRSKEEGGIYFFTVVTYQRLSLFTDRDARKILHDAWSDTQQRFPFETLAICLLPDHLHCLWRLPERDANYSIRWKEIKRLFTKGYVDNIGLGEVRNESRQKRHEAAIWQRRFWEHTIFDEKDFERHLDYIHYNPIKHGYVKCAGDWPWSSFHRYVAMGIYEADWVGGPEGRLGSVEWE